MDHIEFLKLFGPVKEAAAAFGVSHADIDHWRKRGIPADRWSEVEEIARERGWDVTGMVAKWRAERKAARAARGAERASRKVAA